jgi:uncharacterized protein
MPLLINLRHLEEKGLHEKGELSLKELDIDPMDKIIKLSHSLTYDVEVEKMDKALLVQGRLKIVLDCDCVRCLKPFAYRLALNNWICHVPLEGEDAVKIINDCVDLTPLIRDDILLAFPQHPLCEPECKGLPHPKKDAGRGGEHEPNMGSPAWAELNKLKLK